MSADTLELPPHGGVRLVTEGLLWKSWKEIRKSLRYSNLRDIVDFVDYDVNPERWISRTIQQINSGVYEPRHPQRFAIGKSRGFSRWMTLPQIPDLVLYHAASTLVVERVQRRRRRHRYVYFARDKMGVANTPNAYNSNPFLRWLQFSEYRKSLFRRKYEYIVITDISNFFDSIAHVQLEAVLFELGFPRSFVGLLQILLERLMFRDPYSAHPRVGIPVDEFGCSRCLAHALLFAHDDRMVKIVGEESYTRWMDDQAFGVASPVLAYRLLADIDISLRRMHLVPNAGKSRIMSMRDARKYFHLRANNDLDRMETRWAKDKQPTGIDLVSARNEFRLAWRNAQNAAGEGEWTKVLKRFYLAAGRLGLRLFVRRSHQVVIDSPGLAPRVAQYLRAVCSTDEFISRAIAIVEDPCIVHIDVRKSVLEELLKIDFALSSANDRRRLRTMARKAISRPSKSDVPPQIGVLLLFKFGDRRSARSIVSSLRKAPESVEARSYALVLSTYGDSYYEQLRDLDNDLIGRSLADSIRLVERARRFPIPTRIKARFQLRRDSMSGISYLDVRTVLIASVFALNDQSRRSIRDIVRARWLPKVSVGDRELLVKYGLA